MSEKPERKLIKYKQCILTKQEGVVHSSMVAFVKVPVPVGPIDFRRGGVWETGWHIADDDTPVVESAGGRPVAWSAEVRRSEVPEVTA